MTTTVTQSSPFKDITAEIRKQSRALAKTFNCKVSVTKDEYSGGRKVYVTVTNAGRYHLCPIFRQWQNKNPHSSRWDYSNPRECEPGQVHLADWAIELMDGLKKIVDQYNWDKSDSMTDYFHVNYYSDVDFCGKLDKENQDALDYYLETHTAEEITSHFDDLISKTLELKESGCVNTETSDQDADQVTETDTGDNSVNNVLTVDFAHRTEKEEPALQDIPSLEELRVTLAKLDEERIELQAQIERARERQELTMKIAEQMLTIAALKKELADL